MKPLAAATVAVVDDEENIRDTVGFALRREGYEVETYADGASAWKDFQKELPDLAVLDILMPQMDGRELCRKLRSLSELLPILFLTSRDDELDRVLGLELGADDYLCKPFSMPELMARVKGALASRGARPRSLPHERASGRLKYCCTAREFVEDHPFVPNPQFGGPFPTPFI